MGERGRERPEGRGEGGGDERARKGLHVDREKGQENDREKEGSRREGGEAVRNSYDTIALSLGHHDCRHFHA